jgi:hypothetical protein
MTIVRGLVAVGLLAGVVAAAGARPPEPLTPADAVKLPAGRVVTVQFEVGTATPGYVTARPDERLVFLSPVEALPNNATFQVLLTGKAAALPRPGPGEGPKGVDQIYQRRRVRVTGRLEAFGPDDLRTVRLVTSDPADVKLFGMVLR